MALRPRSPHNRGTGPQVRVLPADELPPATPADVPKGRDGRGLFVKGNKVGTGLKGVSRRNLDAAEADPAFRPFLLEAARYAKARKRELAAAHGGSISEGVRGIVDSEAQARAAARFLAWKASATGDEALLKTAAKLTETARQHALAAWELAARECKVRAPTERNEMWDRLSGLRVDDSEESPPPVEPDALEAKAAP